MHLPRAHNAHFRTPKGSYAYDAGISMAFIVVGLSLNDSFLGWCCYRSFLNAFLRNITFWGCCPHRIYQTTAAIHAQVTSNPAPFRKRLMVSYAPFFFFTINKCSYFAISTHRSRIEIHKLWCSTHCRCTHSKYKKYGRLTPASWEMRFYTRITFDNSINTFVRKCEHEKQHSSVYVLNRVDNMDKIYLMVYCHAKMLLLVSD